MTLVELMVVVAIIGIVVLLGTPSYRLWATKYHLKSAVSDLHGTVTLARMVAMNQNTTVTVTPELLGNQLTVTFTNPLGAMVLPPFSKTIDLGTAMAGGPITFNSFGLRVAGPVGVTQALVFTNNGLVYSVGVNPAGKVRWCPNDSGNCQ